MRQYGFSVKFITGQIELVTAFCVAEAEILAQAKQIRKGNNHFVDSVKKVD